VIVTRSTQLSSYVQWMERRTAMPSSRHCARLPEWGVGEPWRIVFRQAFVSM
jgi:hypothetical protein